MSILRAVGSAILAATCPCCGQAMGWGRYGVCEFCWDEAIAFHEPRCDVCGGHASPASIGGGTPRRCATCAGAPWLPSAVGAWGPYAGRLRDLIHALKYRGRYHLATPLGAMIAAALEAEGLKERARRGAIVPVPLSPRRQASRGYNQAALLARETARGLALPRRAVAGRALKRVKEAPPQAGLGRAERLKNPGGTYAVDERVRRRIEGRHVLLVDDVLTTGATASECARLLLEAGAADVIVAVVARTPPGGAGVETIESAPASAPGRNE